MAEMNRNAKHARKAVLLLLILSLIFLMSSCGGKKDLTLYEYKDRLMRERSAEKQLKTLYDMASLYEEELASGWWKDMDPGIGNGLPENLLPETENAEMVEVLPDLFRGKKWMVLYDDSGSLSMNGSLYTHLPAELRAASFEDADAVMLLRHTEIRFERAAEELNPGRNATAIKHDYACYVLDVGSRKTFCVPFTPDTPRFLRNDESAKINTWDLWERIWRILPTDAKRTLKEDIEFFRSLEQPARQLSALYDLAERHAEDFAGGKPAPEICEYIYSGTANVQKIMVPFIPDFDTSRNVDEIPESFRNRKYLCLEIQTSTDGKESVYWRGGLYARLPESLRASTLEEADAVLVVRVYQVKVPSMWIYVYSDGSVSSFDYEKRGSVYLYDLTDKTLVRTGWGTSDTVMWPALAEALGLDPTAAESRPALFDPSAAYEAGDTFFYGAYDQDGNPDNGDELLEWMVLDHADGELLLLSVYGLDELPYSEDENSADWETSSLHGWLNGTFLDKAFSSPEQERIVPVGEDGKNKVSLLSREELTRYFHSRFALICPPAGQPEDHCRWWLSTVKSPNHAYFVALDGDVQSSQMRVDYDIAVRPVIRIRMGE